MSKWEWIVSILIVVSFIVYANPETFDNVKFKIFHPLGSVKLGKSELENVCIQKINNNLNMLRKSSPSDTKISLVDYVSINNKKDAIEYANIWWRSSLYLEKSLEDINSLNENVTIFIGVIKVEAYNVMVQSPVTITAVIVCSNNTLLPGSKKQLS